MLSAKKVIRIASFGAALLAVIKLTLWIISWSMVIIASAVDSVMDLIISMLNLFALKAAEKPADKEHNYGHGKIEAIAALAESAFIWGSGLILIYSSIQKYLNKTPLEETWAWIITMGIAILITGIIIFLLRKVNKKDKSLIIQADLMHYEMDILTNIWIIITLIIIQYTQWFWMDPIIAGGMALYMIYSARSIAKKGIDLLMDTSLGKDHEIGAIILAHPAVKSFHELRTHQSGNRAFISFHMVFKNAGISLKEAHQVNNDVETSIKKKFKKANVLIKLDPIDDEKSPQ